MGFAIDYNYNLKKIILTNKIFGLARVPERRREQFKFLGSFLKI